MFVPNNHNRNENSDNVSNSFDFYQQFADMKIQTPANKTQENDKFNYEKTNKRKFFNKKSHYLPSFYNFYAFLLIFTTKKEKTRKNTHKKTCFSRSTTNFLRSSRL